MEVIIAHSEKSYTEHLSKFLINKGISNIHIYHEGFDALTHIIKHRSKIIIIEEQLPGLNVSDIKNALIFKRIKSKIIIIKPFDKLNPHKILSKIHNELSVNNPTS